MSRLWRGLVVFGLFGPLLFVGRKPILAQDALPPARLSAEPDRLVVVAGQPTQLEIQAFDANGNRLDDVGIRLAAPRTEVDVRGWYDDGQVVGLSAGSYDLVAIAAGADGPIRLTIPLVVEWPAVDRVEIGADAGAVYVGSSVRHRVHALHADGTTRPDPEARWTTSDETIATVDAFGFVTGVSPGEVTIEGQVEGVSNTVTHTVERLPEGRLWLEGGRDRVRTGDVQHFQALFQTEGGDIRDDLPVTWSLTYEPAPGIRGPSAPGQLKDGSFVADVPGLYTVVASAGPLQARRSMEVEARDVVQSVEVMGQGRITDHYTSDLWVFEGVNGRDYAITGSRQAQSHAFVWDITDPTNIVKTDSIQVDARSLNDVKTSPDGRYGVLSREGASNRRNGVVILDLADPAHPTIASVYDEGLTGGVHNVFATDTHLFALSGGEKYVILDMSDITNPRYVSEYDHPDSQLHDVWVHDGLAYSAEWETGVVVVDVGNGRWGGSLDEPKLAKVIPIGTGATHAVFPYFQESTGKFYLFVGDEIIGRRGLAWEGNGPDFRQPYDPETGRGGYPRATTGYIQIVDFTNPDEAEMVARYEVTEYGTHNIWVEDDVLYQAYYEGGARMVDVSGELMGNLYTQGREISVFKANDPLAWIPNSPGAWSVIPYKGNIFFSDNTSGLWSIRLAPRERLTP